MSFRAGVVGVSVGVGVGVGTSLPRAFPWFVRMTVPFSEPNVSTRIVLGGCIALAIIARSRYCGPKMASSARSFVFDDKECRDAALRRSNMENLERSKFKGLILDGRIKFRLAGGGCRTKKESEE